MSEHRATIYYDDDCGFCRRMTRIALHIDNHRGRRLIPKRLQHPNAAAELLPLDLDERMASWHLRTAGGEVYSGGDAFGELARIWRFDARIVRAIEANQPLLNRAYAWIARNRAGFGRLTRWMPDLPKSATKNPPA